MLLDAFLVDALAGGPPFRQVEPCLGLEGDQPLDREDGDAVDEGPVVDEQPVVVLVEEDYYRLDTSSSMWMGARPDPASASSRFVRANSSSMVGKDGSFGFEKR